MANKTFYHFQEHLLQPNAGGGEYYDLSDGAATNGVYVTIVTNDNPAADVGDGLSALTKLTGITDTPTGSVTIGSNGLYSIDASTTLNDATAGAIKAVVLYQGRTVNSVTNPLIAMFDGGSGFGPTAQGNPIIVTWSGSGVFRLGAA